MEQIDTNTLTLIAVAVVGILVLILLFRRPTRDDGALLSEVGSLKEAIEKKDGELRGALKRADGGEALAEERKNEVDRLNGDLSKLRLKLEEAAREERNLASTISSQKTQIEAEREASNEKIKTLTELRRDMEGKFRE